MVDWLASMQQTYEYYEVDPGTWKDMKQIPNIKSCTIERDSEAETLGSATLSMTEMVGECYMRVYLITIQNGVKERHPLGTFLIQTPSSSFDGKIREVDVEAYTPLLELKESLPPIGYSVLKNEYIMQNAYRLVNEHTRAPVINSSISTDRLYSDFVANTDDTWLRYTSDLIANAKYNFALDPMGNISFAPEQKTEALQPVWTYTDDNSSILMSSLSMDHDLYGIPNVVEVVCSTDELPYYARVVNDDPSSPTSTVSRGREIVYRVTDPSQVGNPTQHYIDEYAERVLKELSSVEYTITYTHGYCPVRLGDCVRLNYSRAGLTNIRAKVISQSIECVPGCRVTETAVFTAKLWR